MCFTCLKAINHPSVDMFVNQNKLSVKRQRIILSRLLYYLYYCHIYRNNIYGKLLSNTATDALLFERDDLILTDFAQENGYKILVTSKRPLMIRNDEMTQGFFVTNTVVLVP